MDLRDLRTRTAETTPLAAAPVSQVITVFSPKGGVGKTLLACSLAVTASSRLGRKTLLLDLDLDSGDVSVHLDLPEGPSISDLLPYCGDLKPDTLKRFAVGHKASGVDVITAPPRPEMSEFVRSEHVESLIEAARKSYQCIIVDTPPAMDHDLVYSCLERSDSQVLVVHQDLACVKQCKGAVELLRRLGFDPAERTHVLINRFSEKSLLTPTKIRSFLGIERVLSVADDRDTVERAILDGRPVALTSSTSPVAQNLSSAVSVILGTPDQIALPDKKQKRLIEAVRHLW